MPVVAATDLPAARPAGGVQFAASAPSELFWLLLYLAHPDKKGGSHTGYPLADDHPELARRVAGFWRDPGEGFTELFVLGQRGGTLYEPEPARFIEGLDAAIAAPDAPLGLESEAPSEIEAVRRRLGVLREDATVRGLYRELLTDAWAIVADDWEREGRAQVQASLAEWPGRLERAGSLVNALSSRHILRRYLPMVEAADARGEVVVTPLYLAGVGHLIKLPGVLLLGAGLRDGDHLAKRRAEAEAAGPEAQAAGRPDARPHPRPAHQQLAQRRRPRGGAQALAADDLRARPPAARGGAAGRAARRRADALLHLHPARRGPARRGTIGPAYDLRVVMWDPPASVVEAANSTRFARDHGLASHAELLRRSVEDPAWFWDAWARYLPLAFDEPYDVVLDESRGPEWARWFAGGRLNLVESCVHRHARGERADRVAIVAETEAGAIARRTYAELSADVARAADGLAALGVQEGDRVALVMPMSCELVTAYYAIAHLGAVSVPIFSGFSASAIASRLVDADVVCVVTADGSERRGRFVPVKATVDEAVAAAPSVRHVVVHRHAGADVPWHEGRDVAWADLLAGGDPARPHASVDSEHPLMVAYTSGTTGRPKGAVHVHAGFLAKIAQEVWFHADLREGDALHWATDMGWIMGPWETVGTHAAGQTLVLYDGAPDFPDPGRLWRFAAEHRLAFCGVSPTLIRALQGHGAEHARAADLSPPAGLRLHRRAVEPGALPLAVRGGRRGAAADRQHQRRHGDRRDPGGLRRDHAARRVLARRARAGHGRRRLGRGGAAGHATASVGELVCTRPWPSMTRGIWNDPDRYLRTYWSRWPGVWVHGDWASVAPDGQWFLHGRSDDTLNVAGKRVGPAEYESALVAHPAVVEACAVGIPHDVKGETAWCYVLLAPGYEPSDELRAELARAVEDGAGQGVPPGPHRVRPAHCRAPAPPRSCAAPCGRWRSARTPATSRRWRTPPRWKRCGPRPSGRPGYVRPSWRSALLLIDSTMAGSRRVVASPSSRPSATSRSRRRMILPERVFGRSGVKSSMPGPGELADLGGHVADQLVAQRVRLLDAVARDHEDRDLLAPDRVGRADGRGLRDGRVRHERRLHLGRGDAVAGDVDDVVDAAHQPEVAVLVGLRAVAGEVHGRPEAPEVRVDEALRRRPRGCAASTATAAAARGSRRRRAAPPRPARRRSPP